MLGEMDSGLFFRGGSGGGSFFGFFGDRLAGDLLFLLGSGAHERDGDVAGAAEDRTRGALGARLEAALGGGGTDDGFLDDQRAGIQREIVLGIGDGGLEGLADELGGFLRGEGEDIEGARYRQALNFTGDVTRLFGRESERIWWCF